MNMLLVVLALSTRPETLLDFVQVEIEGASAKASELSPLAESSSHMHPISLEKIVERELAARAKRAVVDGWLGLLQLRRRVEGRWLRWSSFTAHLLFALVRIWRYGRQDQCVTHMIW